MDQHVGVDTVHQVLQGLWVSSIIFRMSRSWGTTGAFRRLSFTIFNSFCCPSSSEHSFSCSTDLTTISISLPSNKVFRELRSDMLMSFAFKRNVVCKIG